jgi:adenylate cyclase
VLFGEGRLEESIPERERALVLNPSDAGAIQGLAYSHLQLGHFEKSLELFDKAIGLSPRDPTAPDKYQGKSWTYFGLKQYDQAIDWGRRAIAAGGAPYSYASIAASLALTGREMEAREVLQRYLALLPPNAQLRTIAGFKAYGDRPPNANHNPSQLDNGERLLEGLRKAGMPEGEAKTN